MKSLEEIKKILAAHKKGLEEEYGVKSLALFGSIVRGEEKETSDVDILVDFHEVPDLLEFLALETHLEGLLGIKVDLVRKQVIRPELRDRILGEAVEA